MATRLFVISYYYPTHATRKAMAVAAVFFTGISKIPPPSGTTHKAMRSSALKVGLPGRNAILSAYLATVGIILGANRDNYYISSE